MDLNKLKEQAVISQKIHPQFDDASMAMLSKPRRQAWGSLLSSLANSENIENLILDPLIKKFQSNSDVHEYLRAHGQDEVKHFQWLSQYVKVNTQYVRPGRSLSDLIFYEGILPRIGAYADDKPIYLFCLMYFYELFTLDFYKELIRAASEDKLQRAQSIFQYIRLDEVRHCQAAKNLIHMAHQEKGVQRIDILCVQILLRLFQFDMATFWWCVHNQRVRKSTSALGIPPERMWEMSSQALEKTLDFLRGTNS